MSRSAGFAATELLTDSTFKNNQTTYDYTSESNGDFYQNTVQVALDIKF